MKFVLFSVIISLNLVKLYNENRALQEIRMFNFIKVFFILFLAVQTTVSTVVAMEQSYDDFCLVRWVVYKN